MTNSTAVALALALTACLGKPTSPEPARAAATSASAPPVCTLGADQTCNDDPAISSLHGTCNPDRSCTCHGSFEKSSRTGRCQ